MRPDLIPSIPIIHWNLEGFCMAKYNVTLIIPIIRNPNNQHPIKNAIGDTLDHFFTVILGVGWTVGIVVIIGGWATVGICIVLVVTGEVVAVVTAGVICWMIGVVITAETTGFGIVCGWTESTCDLLLIIAWGWVGVTTSCITGVETGIDWIVVLGGIDSLIITWVCGKVTTEGTGIVVGCTVFGELMVVDEIHIGWVGVTTSCITGVEVITWELLFMTDGITVVLTGLVIFWLGVIWTTFVVGTDVSTQKMSQRLVSWFWFSGDIIGITGFVLSSIVCV